MPGRPIDGRAAHPSWSRRTALIAGGLAALAALAPDRARAADRGWLGVRLGPGAAGGVRVERVVRKSPAASAGVEEGDEVLAVEGTPVKTPKELALVVSAAGVGQTVILRVLRAGSERDIPVKLEANPGPDEILRRDKIGTFAPDWAHAKPAFGTVPRSVKKLKGRVAIVDFWATWCLPCRLIAPKLSELSDRLGPQGLTVIGFTPDPVDRAEKFARDEGLTYAIATDVDDEVAMDYGVMALPTMFVIDKRGVIREVFIGFSPGETKQLGELVEKLIAEPAPP